ncbi:MAG: TIGR03986 family CRISPR-associated RAMP protein [Paludibacter sp.]|nr:TIGR03986 family CRISPR-associated RAMP protein [Paludibacter sp.]
MSVKSTYNFVPAPTEEEVFKPEWANQVSHDIPFSDGESGEIEIKITAQTPIFIRNGHSKADKEIFDNFKAGKLTSPTKEENAAIERYLEFSNIEINGKKEYFIPGSSLKGMFRNVLEIMSFSRMSQVQSERIFTLRDMNNKQYSNNEIRNTRTGWLTKQNDIWSIQDCDSDRVRIESITKKFGIPNFDDLSSKEKYEQCKITSFNKEFDFEFDCTIPKTGDVYNITNGKTEKSGCLVMFGAMQNKKYEYIFQSPNKDSKTFELVNQDIVKRIQDIENELDKSLWKHFFDMKVYSIPVFYKLNDSKEKKVIHFGFSKLYKLNNTLYLKELEPLKSYFDENKKRTKYELKYDLASLIFGHTQDEALKGRVMIGHAVSTNSITQLTKEERVLGSPKPSFYPAYLVQPKNINQNGINYKTYLDKDAILKGFKRYPLHQNLKKGTSGDNENIATQFIPLKSGTLFICKVRFQNLRRIELGALLSSIVFHNTIDAFHSLGSGKPYGFGKIKTEILNSSKKFEEALSEFEYQMNLHTNSKLTNKSNWLLTENIRELFALTQTSSDINENLLVYPILENKDESNKQRKNQFNNVKKDNLSISKYSEMNGIASTKSLLSEDIEIKKQEEFQQRLSLYEKLILEATNLLQKGDFDAAITCVDKAETNCPDEVSHFELKRQIEKAISIRKQENDALQTQQAIEQSRLESNKVPLSEKIGKLDKFPTIFGNVKTWMKLNSIESLENSDIEVLTNKLVAVYTKMKPNEQKTWSDLRKWSDLSKIIGDKETQKIFDDLI